MKYQLTVILTFCFLGLKAQRNINASEIDIIFINDTVSFKHKIGLKMHNNKSYNLLIYDYLDVGEKCRFSNIVLQFEQKVNGIYTHFPAYSTNYGDRNLTDTLRTFDLSRHILYPGHTDTLLLETLSFGTYISNINNPTHEFRVKAFMRVAFINNNAPKEPGDQNDYIEYKESPWFYYRSKN